MPRYGTASKAALAAIAAALVAAPQLAGAAKISEQKRAAVLQAVVDCRAVTDRDKRLDCFDAASAKLDEAEATGQVVVVDREQAKAVRKDVFGLSLPSLDIFGGKADKIAKEDSVDEIAGTVKTAWRGGDGKWNVELDNGAVWRQIDNYDIPMSPHQGSTVEIKKGALGSFILKGDGQPGVKAHRDR